MPVDTTIVIAVLSAALALVAVDDGLQRRGRAQDRQEATTREDGLEAARRQAEADLAECRAKVTPESITATGTVLEAAQAGDLAQAGLSADIVQAVPGVLLAQAVVDQGSPRVVAAHAGLGLCAQVVQTQDSATLGCTEVARAWVAAVGALESCPSCPPCLVEQPAESGP